MKNTREITTGAILLAIYGALLLIDRQFSFFFIEMIALAVPVLIIIFGNLYNHKDGIYFSIALLILAFVLSPNPYSYFYIPVGVVIGNVYNFMLYKQIRSKFILVVIMVLFAIFDLLYMLVISPIFLGIGFDALVKEVGEMFSMLLSYLPIEINIDLTKFTFTMAFASLVITSILEAFVVHIIVLVLFKRFKINKESFNIKGVIMLKPVSAYFLLAGSTLFYASFKVQNDIVTAILFTIGAICMYVLIYYGYIYALMFTRIRRKNKSPFMVLLIILLLLPYSLIMLLIIGFLYGTGPLQKYLVPKQGDNNEKN